MLFADAGKEHGYLKNQSKTLVRHAVRIFACTVALSVGHSAETGLTGTRESRSSEFAFGIIVLLALVQAGSAG